MKKIYTKTTEMGTGYYKDKACTILHRLDGPAFVDPKRQLKAWWVNGKRHRLDGPALVAGAVGDWYFIDGTPYHSLKEYKKEAAIYKKFKVEDVNSAKDILDI